MYLLIWEMVNKHMYSICIYISLLVNVSVSLIISEVLPHMTLGNLFPVRTINISNC